MGMASGSTPWALLAQLFCRRVPLRRLRRRAAFGFFRWEARSTHAVAQRCWKHPADNPRNLGPGRRRTCHVALAVGCETRRLNNDNSGPLVGAIVWATYTGLFASTWVLLSAHLPIMSLIDHARPPRGDSRVSEDVHLSINFQVPPNNLNKGIFMAWRGPMASATLA